jgi:hypothetical protein
MASAMLRADRKDLRWLKKILERPEGSLTSAEPVRRCARDPAPDPGRRAR